MSSDSIFPIYKEILNSLPALAFEDVYITGIISEKLNITGINTDYFVKLVKHYFVVWVSAKRFKL
jgi:hypothetical protein